MVCYSPLRAFQSAQVGENGKRAITFNRNGSFSGVPLRLPCGQCVGCRLEHSRQWAMRCMNEKQLHSDSVFATVTYANEHLPEFGTLVKAHCKAFQDRLRWHRGSYRFYMCGEYGEKNARPHYHYLLFGLDFPDKKFFGRNDRGEPLYISAELDRVWGLGLCVIGEVTFDSAAYVARYIMDKKTGPLASEAYDVCDRDGVIYSRLPEFTNMSRRPGIGREWYEKYKRQTYLHDNIIMNGKKVRPPRYYDTLYQLEDAAKLDALKVARRRRAMKHRKENLVDRRRVREVVALRKLNLLNRSV